MISVFGRVTAFIVLWILIFVAFNNIIPQVTPSKELPEAITTASVSAGKELALTRGCMVCHAIGSDTGRAPDLANIGRRASTRIEGFEAMDYMVESLLDPNTFLVEGYGPIMPPAHKPPVSLTDEELTSVVMYLESLGSKPSDPEDIKLKLEEFKTKAGGE